MSYRTGFRWSPRNLVLSSLLVALSIAAGGYAFVNMRAGTPANMGPGFFPIMLTAILALLSIGVAFLPRDLDAEALRLAPVRAIVIVLICPVVFGFSIEPFGMVISVFLVIFISCLASRVTTPVQALLLSVAFTAFCVLVFHYLLNMTIPLWGEVFTG